MPTFDPLEWPQGNPLFEVQWRALSEALAGNGIESGGACEVTATGTALQIEVASGSATYAGSSYSLGSAETHTLSSGDGTYDRWDTVYLDTSGPTSGVREGTPEASPEPPDIQGDEILLAVIYVPQGASDVPDGNILNWRAAPAETSDIDASTVPYDDATTEYGVGNVNDALDALQYAVQIDTHPLDAGDLKTAMNKTWTGTHTFDAAQTWNTLGSAPSAPASGYRRLYFKDDGNLYKLQPDGTETQVGGGGSSSSHVEDLVKSPNGHIPTALLENGESAEISVPVPDNFDLKVYRWGGYKIADGTAPTGLSVRMWDGSDNSVADAQTVNSEQTSSPLATGTNTSGSLSIFKLGIDNGTGSNFTTDGVGAFFAYVVE